MTNDAEPVSCRDADSDLLTHGLGEIGLELAGAGFAALWHERAVRPKDLVPSRGRATRKVALGLVDQGRCEIDDQGRLVGIHGLTLRPTRHNFVHDGRTHHTWCALDSIGIPAALALDAVAHTDCPSCQRPLEVIIDNGIPHGIDSGVLWLPAAGTHMIADFCSHTDLYCSVEHLGRRIDTTVTPGEVIDLAAAAALGRDIWSDVARVLVDKTSTR